MIFVKNLLGAIFLISFLPANNSSLANEAIGNKEKTALSGKVLKEYVVKFFENKGVKALPAVNEKKAYPPCSEDIAIFPMFKSWATVELVCSDQKNGWKTIVRTRVNETIFAGDTRTKNNSDSLHALVVSKSLGKGHILKKEDLKIIEVQRNNGVGIFFKEEDLIGRRIKTPISAGFLIRTRHLYPDWVISDGDVIEVIDQGRSISVSVKAIALENGQLGEKIRVKNLSSDKIMLAWILNEKKVSIKAKTYSN